MVILGIVHLDFKEVNRWFEILYKPKILIHCAWDYTHEYIINSLYQFVYLYIWEKWCTLEEDAKDNEYNYNNASTSTINISLVFCGSTLWKQGIIMQFRPGHEKP